MSIVVPTFAGDSELHRARRHQQQDDDGDLNLPPAPLLSAHTPFTLHLRDGVAPSPDRDRRTVSFDQQTMQRKTSSSNGDSGSDHMYASPHKQLQSEVVKLKEALQVMRAEKDNEIAFLKDQLAALATNRTSGSSPITKADMPSRAVNQAKPRLVPWLHSITERGDIQTSRLGRHASLKTIKALSDLQKQQQQQQQHSSVHSSSAPPLSAGCSLSANAPSSSLAERMAAAFLNPVLSLPYLHSIQFGADLVELSAQVCALLETEERCLSLASPVYVFGDLHGNLLDLQFFSSHLWKFGFSLTAGSFLFLGDYVDRGVSSLECVAYLFAQKLLHPRKVFLLRGNHETRAVNGLEAYYGSGCFLTQCRQRFGHDEGYIVWHQINHAFDRLPLAATIDESVFCVHGGIPRAIATTHAANGESTLDAIRKLPVTAPMDVLDKKYYDANPQLTMVSDMLWGDPAKEEHEAALDPTTGFGKSVLRGGNAICFGSKAIDGFLQTNGFAYIMRAHEATMDGVGVAKSAKVLTIFSTSKDHGLGDGSTCGCVLVDGDRIAAINRSAGQQQVVRRRRSITSLESPRPPPPATQAPGPPTAINTTAHGDGASRTSQEEHRVQARSPPFEEAAQAASASAPASSARRRSSHRDAYPSALCSSNRGDGVVATTTAVASAGATETNNFRRHRLHRRRDQDESDSTDDEATPAPRRLSLSTSSSRTSTGTSENTTNINSRPRAVSPDDNNQSDDA